MNWILSDNVPYNETEVLWKYEYVIRLTLLPFELVWTWTARVVYAKGV